MKSKFERFLQLIVKSNYEQIVKLKQGRAKNWIRMVHYLQCQVAMLSVSKRLEPRRVEGGLCERGLNAQRSIAEIQT